MLNIDLLKKIMDYKAVGYEVYVDDDGLYLKRDNRMVLAAISEMLIKFN